jgi:hypothetical protein
MKLIYSGAPEKGVVGQAGYTPAVKGIGFGGLWAGLGPRVVMIGTLTGLQWFAYGQYTRQERSWAAERASSASTWKLMRVGVWCALHQAPSRPPSACPLLEASKVAALLQDMRARIANKLQPWPPICVRRAPLPVLSCCVDQTIPSHDVSITSHAA